MSEKAFKSRSKFLSLVLRHEPAKAGVSLDDAGWVDVEVLLAGCARAGQSISRVELDEIVRSSDKQRFAFNADGTRIRANQGHSVEVELGYAPADPPAVLYHGTAERSLAAIRAEGLTRQARHHVHLSVDRTTAEAVGRRHGRVVVLTVDAAAMRADGHTFYLSANGVWLVEVVPHKYLSPP